MGTATIYFYKENEKYGELSNFYPLDSNPIIYQEISHASTCHRKTSTIRRTYSHNKYTKQIQNSCQQKNSLNLSMAKGFEKYH
jgi:predicted NAD-dependent protein-ADP-ribosyltransferase YbiA (DUF1768 family)